MSEHIPESDWRWFKEVHPLLLERFCRRTLSDLAEIAASADGSAHDRYLKAYRLLKRRDRELAHAFDDFRRSTAIMQLAIMRSMGLLTDEELRRFTPQTQRFVESLSSLGRT